jgi:hypothetical protein
MCPANEATGVKVEKSSAVEAMQKARQQKQKLGGSNRELSDEESFALRMVQQSKKACTIIAGRIKSGKHVTPESLKACATLTANLSDMLHD